MDKRLRKTRLFALKVVLVFAMTFSVMFAGFPQRANACCCSCSCIIQEMIERIQQIIQKHIETQQHFRDWLDDFEDWMIDTDWHDGTPSYFNDMLYPALRAMTEQFTATMVAHTAIIGSMMDAQAQLDTQLLLQELTIEAHKDYHPSVGMCEFGTTTRSLAASDENSALSGLAIAARMQQRELANANANASEGPQVDRKGRLTQFVDTYCDFYDNNPATDGANWWSTGFGLVCNGGAGGANANPEWLNRDIDFARVMLDPRTLNLDFSDGNLSIDEEDVMAMATNLYSHRVFDPLSERVLRVFDNQSDYLDMRAVVAKRSVAEASFNALAALKTEGSVTMGDPGGANTAGYLYRVLMELGLTEDESKAIIGEYPSYYAQMEVLAKKLYQRPDFYVELYDKPENVNRKSVAMQAIGVMLDRDIYDSYIRSEAIMSTLLELRVSKAQEAVANDLYDLKSVR